MIWIALIAPGLLVAYFLYLRPLLRAMPLLKRFYEQADGFWSTVWAFCGRSVTMAFSYFIQVLSWALQAIDPIASFLGDPDLRQQITDGLQANPKVLGYILMAISFLTIAARLQGLVKQHDGTE
jgi:hypothetical protein